MSSEFSEKTFSNKMEKTISSFKKNYPQFEWTS